MRERLLRDFLVGDAEAPLLAEGLSDVLGRVPLRPGGNLIEDLNDELQVAPGHLVRLCDAAIEGELDPDDLKAAARFLRASDRFVWPGSDLVAQVLGDWSEVRYPLTSNNLIRYRDGLLAGTHPFTRG